MSKKFKKGGEVWVLAYLALGEIRRENIGGLLSKRAHDPREEVRERNWLSKRENQRDHGLVVENSLRHGHRSPSS